MVEVYLIQVIRKVSHAASSSWDLLRTPITFASQMERVQSRRHPGIVYRKYGGWTLTKALARVVPRTMLSERLGRDRNIQSSRRS